MDENCSKQPAFEPPESPLILRVFSYARELSAELKPGVPLLIGSGSNCHIQIDALPELHSQIQYDGQTAPRLCPVEPVPLVLVNGELKDGHRGEPTSFSFTDTLHIGLRVIVRLATEGPSVGKPMLSKTTNSAPTGERENLMQKPLNELTAAELVELIEQEESQVAEFEEGNQQGLQNLMQAIKMVAREEADAAGPATIPLTPAQPQPAATASPAPTRDPAIEQEIHYLVEELSELVEDLCDQVQSFADAEELTTSGAETTFKKLLREQHDILEKLDTIADLIGGAAEPGPVLRKIA